MRVLNDIGLGTALRRRCFILDNLIVHHHPAIILVILNAGHRFVFRAHYHPTDGPIEYVFNALETGLKVRMNEIFDLTDLTTAVQQLIRGMATFDAFFTHCGYR